ncbi:MAG: PEP-CTERM sorting domain-containing protein [Planctomycetota bacterium]
MQTAKRSERPTIPRPDGLVALARRGSVVALRPAARSRAAPQPCPASVRSSVRLLLAVAVLCATPLLAASAAATAQGPANPVPEPSTFLLVGTGLVGVALTARLRRRKTPR